MKEQRLQRMLKTLFPGKENIREGARMQEKKEEQEGRKKGERKKPWKQKQ